MRRSWLFAKRCAALVVLILLCGASASCTKPTTPNMTLDSVGIAREPNASEWCGVLDLVTLVERAQVEARRSGENAPHLDRASDALSWLVGHVQRAGAMEGPEGVRCAD